MSDDKISIKKLMADDPCPVCGKKIKFHLLMSIKQKCYDLMQLEIDTRPDGQEQKY